MRFIQLDMVVESDLDVNEFNKKFIEWVESYGWSCGGTMCEVDEEGNKINKENCYYYHV